MGTNKQKQKIPKNRISKTSETDIIAFVTFEQTLCYNLKTIGMFIINFQLFLIVAL